MNDAATALDQLAEIYGIVPAYRDIWGAAHAASEETKRALLAGMGVAAGTDAEAEASLRAAETACCHRILPPVAVLDAGGREEIPIWLPEAAEGVLLWTVTGEDGARWQGELELSLGSVSERRAADGAFFARRGLKLPVAVPMGYHRLHVTSPDGDEDETIVIVAPGSCFSIEEAVGEDRVWGVAAQLYGLRSDTDWGMGDFVDLGELGEAAAAEGAAAVGINPVHAGFAADPNHYSPYSPSTRIFLNHLYIDPAAIPEFYHCSEAQRLLSEGSVREALETARRAELVDYQVVSAAKMPVLEAIYSHFAMEASPERTAAFQAFRSGWGESLQRHAVFEALHHHFFTTDMHRWSWRTWPEPFRDPASPEVAAFAAENAARVDFFAWLQWIADEQLGAAQTRMRSAGMQIGIYRDLAVASDGGGSMAWHWPNVVLTGITVGAPPDDLGPQGQDWGLGPLSPHGLRDTAYRPFIESLRASMRHAGALRIDHVMALTRLFWIPPGKTGAEGAYVRYPLEDLIRIVALESRRSHCVIIGEDLGTLPEGFQETLHQFGILSYRIMNFERHEDGGLKPPGEYPAGALVAAATHDMPTVRGFWTARDIDWRKSVIPELSEEWLRDSYAERERVRHSMLDALRAEGLEAGTNVEEPSAPLAEAVHRFIARTPARLLMVQLEDLLDLHEQANLPGTSDEHPNWRRRLPCKIDALFQHPHAHRIVAAVNQERPRGLSH